ncbi:M23 family metallopeptidase [Paenibacillus sp. D51F]
MPMKFHVSSEFGVMEEIRSGREHRGVDLAMPRGTELHSITSGTVERIVDHGADNIGRGVIVRTDSGDLHVYGHMDSVSVHAGERVYPGELLGMSGNTGHSSGPHLHFGLIKDGGFADPSGLIPDLQRYSGEIAGPAILGVKGPAWWIAEKAAGAAKEHVTHSFRDHLFDWLTEIGGIILNLSYGAGLIGCTVLIILGAIGLRDGYRWSGLLFGVYSLIRLIGGGISR